MHDSAREGSGLKENNLSVKSGEGLYWIETYGCEMNKAESAALDRILKQRGLSPAHTPKDADVVILNTCSVRQTAEDRIYGRLGFYTALKKSKKIHLSVIGCMAERLGERLKERAPAVDSVIGMGERNNLHALLGPWDGAEILTSREGMYTGGTYAGGEYGFYEVYGSQDEIRTYIPIMHGCNNFCSYCIVPYVRGREVSRNPDEIMREIAFSREKGIKEITLLGQNVNSYSYGGLNGGNQGFAGLVRRIGREHTGDVWFRFLTSHPKDFTDDIIEAIAEHPVFCRLIHLPVQHASDRILGAMNRKYTRAYYEGRVKKIREALPDAMLTTDIMVGFPGEEDADFRELLDLMRNVGFSEAFTYYYNPREGTKSWDMGDTVPHETKIARLQEVIALQQAVTRELKTKELGSAVTVLAENISKKNAAELIGRTERNGMVVFPATEESLCRFLRVKLVSLNGNTFRGELLS